MDQIRGLSDLRPYGIEVLTGEACGLGLRVLCDVTARGRQLLMKTYGLPNLSLHDAWNGTGLPAPHTHIGSIMLAPDAYLALGIFALLDSGCSAVYTFHPSADTLTCFAESRRALLAVQQDIANGGALQPATLALVTAATRVTPASVRRDGMVYGVRDRDDAEYLADYLEMLARDGWSSCRYAYTGTARDRNIHQMTQRTA